MRVRRPTIIILAALAAMVFVASFAGKSDADVKQTWSDSSSSLLITAGNTVDYRNYGDLLRKSISVFGNLESEPNSVSYSSDSESILWGLRWYKTNFGLVSRGGTFILPNSEQYAGFVDVENSGEELLPTPNPDIAIWEKQVGDDNGYEVKLLNAKSTRFEKSIGSTPGGPSIYEIKASSGPGVYDLSPKSLKYGGKYIWQDDTPLYQDVAFSSNGQWMVLWDSINKEIQKINLETFEVSYLKLKDSDSIEPDDLLVMSISDSGRYLAVANQGYFFRLYLMDGSCIGNYSGGDTPRYGCTDYRDLGAALDDARGEDEENTFGGIPKFVNDDLLSFVMQVAFDGSDKDPIYYLRPSNTKGTNYIALGDSYASGEGEGNSTFYSGTDVQGINMCHLSKLSYPYLIGQDLGLDSTHSVACSGAKMINVLGGAGFDNSLTNPGRTNQYLDNSRNNVLGSWLPGVSSQLSMIQKNMPDIVTVSMSGNDIGFADIIESCLEGGTCYPDYEDRLELVNLINDKFNQLVDMYNKIKLATLPDARIYVVGYPSIVKSLGDCGLRQPLDLNIEETVFANELENYLNAVIKLASERAGVKYIDVSDVFYGHRLCEGGAGTRAVNGVTIGRESVHIPLVGNVVSKGSFHPTIFGHRLLANAIEKRTNNFTAPMPTADPSIVEPIADDSLPIIQSTEKTGRDLNEIVFLDASNQIVYGDDGVSVEFKASSSDYVRINPSAPVYVKVHSDPIELGVLRADADGNVSGKLPIPASLPYGFHSLDLYTTDINGNNIDIRETIYVAHSQDDIDGDGVPNSLEPCLIFEAPKDQLSGSDYSCVASSQNSTKDNSNVARVAAVEATNGISHDKVVGHSKPKPSTSNLVLVYRNSGMSLMPRQDNNGSKIGDQISLENQNRSRTFYLWLFLSFGFIFTFVIFVRYAMTKSDERN